MVTVPIIGWRQIRGSKTQPPHRFCKSTESVTTPVGSSFHKDEAARKSAPTWKSALSWRVTFWFLQGCSVHDLGCFFPCDLGFQDELLLGMCCGQNTLGLVLSNLMLKVSGKESSRLCKCYPTRDGKQKCSGDYSMSIKLVLLLKMHCGWMSFTFILYIP